jgi:N-carbamoylputrescine amidase
MGCINRVGIEKPWNLGRFYGTSYFVNPLGQIIACASEENDELLVAEFDLNLIEEIRGKWQFYRDRRPETYGNITEL